MQSNTWTIIINTKNNFGPFSTLNSNFQQRCGIILTILNNLKLIEMARASQDQQLLFYVSLILSF